MAEYIVKDITIEFCKGIINSHQGSQRSRLIAKAFENFAAWLENIPAADVMEVKHGRWHDVYMSSASSFVGTCSICGVSNDIPPVPLAKYCPNCGARMDGGQDDV